MTGDSDKVLKCPQCDSQKFNEVEDGLKGMWD